MVLLFFIVVINLSLFSLFHFKNYVKGKKESELLSLVLISMLLSFWLKLAKIYARYQEAVDALRHEQMGRKQSEAILERVCILYCSSCDHSLFIYFILYFFLNFFAILSGFMWYYFFVACSILLICILRIMLTMYFEISALTVDIVLWFHIIV